MKLDLARFADLDPAFVEHLVRHEAPDRATHFNRLWAYYRNDLTPLGAGLPQAGVFLKYQSASIGYRTLPSRSRLFRNTTCPARTASSQSASGK